MTQFEALDILGEINKHLQDGKFGQAMQAAGMTDDIFPEGLPLEELSQAFAVRLADICKIAGVKYQ